MSNLDIKKIVENLIKTFLEAGKVSLELRKKGLIKKFTAYENTAPLNWVLKRANEKGLPLS